MPRVPITPELREKIFQRDHYTCQYCGRTFPNVALHIIPVSKGGLNNEENLITSCMLCNRRKRDYLHWDAHNIDEAFAQAQAFLSWKKSQDINDVKRERKYKTYTYPATLTYDKSGISIFFPDFPGCMSCADTEPEALVMAEDALAGWLVMAEDREVAKTLKPNQALTLVRVNMSAFRERKENKAVNKMVTLPLGLINKGKEAGINFSCLLQDALIEKLGIESEINQHNIHR